MFPYFPLSLKELVHPAPPPLPMLPAPRSWSTQLPPPLPMLPAPRSWSTQPHLLSQCYLHQGVGPPSSPLLSQCYPHPGVGPPSSPLFSQCYLHQGVGPPSSPLLSQCYLHQGVGPPVCPVHIVSKHWDGEWMREELVSLEYLLVAPSIVVNGVDGIRPTNTQQARKMDKSKEILTSALLCTR